MIAMFRDKMNILHQITIKREVVAEKKNGFMTLKVFNIANL